MKLFIVTLLVIGVSVTEVQARNLKGFNLVFCHLKCSLSQFNCNCEVSDFINRPASCIPRSSLCDGFADCPDGSDEIECICPPDQFQCGCERGGSCFANVIYECLNITDGNQCMTRKSVDTRCTVSPEKQCDGAIDCPWEPDHDELNCSSCQDPQRPNPCRCNTREDMSCTAEGFTCFRGDGRCNRLHECSDTSDEVGCSCEEGEFQCQCYRKDPVTCPSGTGCIPLSQVNNGVEDCSDGSDETPFQNVVDYGSESVSLWRLSNATQCNNTANCNTSSCFLTPSLQCLDSNCSTSEAICISNYTNSTSESCHKALQCSDGGLALSWQFCNNVVDCADDSDEVRNRPGFKCVGQVGNCVLPQRNLYDDIPHCSDEADLCFDGIHQCFQCLDKRLLISSRQLCDGIMDCYDLSDECLCDGVSNFSSCVNLLPTYSSSRLVAAEISNNTRFDNEEIRYNYTIYQNSDSSLIRCSTKWGERMAVLCDGRPECRDFSDECNCEDTPTFCNDTCHSYYPLGDRYCDGVEDEGWRFINDTNCPKGFDEASCPKRFTCKAGSSISIDVLQLCDGIRNCDDGADELNCSIDKDAVTSIPLITTTNSASALRSAFIILYFCSFLFIAKTTSDL